MSQFERIYYIDKAIHEKGSVTTREVATRFGNSERQIKRDIEYMRERVDMPLIYDYEKRGYCYEKEYSLLRYSDEKALIFFSLLRSILHNKEMLPLVDVEALKIVESSMSSDYRDISNKITYTTTIADPPNYTIFSQCCSALKDNVAITIAYLDSQNNPSMRTVEPLHLISYSNKWYMVAWDLTKQDLRSFHLGRIQSIMQTNLPIVNRDLDQRVASYMSAGFGIFNGEETFNVTIELYSPASHAVRQQVWHAKQRLTTRIDERGELVVVLEVPTTHYNEILSKILSFGSLAKPLYPDEFVALWKEKVSDLAQLAES